MIDDLIIIAMLILFVSLIVLWPYVYIYRKNGSNRLLFVCAVTGAVTITQILLSVILLPVIFFGVKFVPQFKEAGLIEHIMPLFHIADYIGEYGTLILLPILYFVLPPLFYRRYSIFRLTIE